MLYRVKTAAPWQQTLLAHVRQHVPITAMGAGLGYGLRFAQGFDNDPAENSVYDHIGAGLKKGLRGALEGTALGYGASHLAKRVAPEAFSWLTTPIPLRLTVNDVARKMNLRDPIEQTPEWREGIDALRASNPEAIPWGDRINLSGILEPARRFALHPTTRFFGGALLGQSLGIGYNKWYADHNLRSLAARKSRRDAELAGNVDAEEAGRLAALKAYLHMGDFQSSMDSPHYWARFSR